MNLDHPTLAIWILIYECRVRIDCRVNLNNLTRYRSKGVGYGLYSLDSSEDIACSKGLALDDKLS